MISSNKIKRLAVRLSIAAVLMFGFGYALVPLYNAFCKATGIQGKTSQKIASQPTAAMVDMQRDIVVEMITQINGSNAPLDFYPGENTITVHPGELRKTSFFVRNHTKNVVTTQAIPSISPGEGAEFFKKTECFCFQKQNIEKEATVEMPLVFYVDPELPKDIHRLTLSYTLYDVTKAVAK